MKIIISPAKKMRYYENEYFKTSKPLFLDEVAILVEKLKSLSIDELQLLLKCSRKLAIDAYNRYQNFSFTSATVPAILCFNGMQYQSMAPNVFNNDEINYVNQHLYILSGLYGILRPFDEMCLYRLDLENKLSIDQYHNLYEFWNSKIYAYLYQDNDIVLNLTSSEYRKVVAKYLKKENVFVDVFFYQEVNHKLVEKIVYVKEARGAMVRYLASNQVQTLEDVTKFNLLGYQYSKVHSSDTKIVFIRKDEKYVTNSHKSPSVSLT